MDAINSQPEVQDIWPLAKNLQDIVNVQIDINRAVWAGNLSGAVQHGTFKTEAEREKYIQSCLSTAFETMQKLLVDSQLKLDLKHNDRPSY